MYDVGWLLIESLCTLGIPLAQGDPFAVSNLDWKDFTGGPGGIVAIVGALTFFILILIKAVEHINKFIFIRKADGRVGVYLVVFLILIGVGYLYYESRPKNVA